MLQNSIIQSFNTIIRPHRCVKCLFFQKNIVLKKRETIGDFQSKILMEANMVEVRTYHYIVENIEEHKDNFHSFIC